VLAHHAGLGQVALHLPIGIQQIHLHARVDHHPHLEQRIAPGLPAWLGWGLGDLGPVADDVPCQTVRQPRQRLLLVRPPQLPPHTVTMQRGSRGSASILLRSRLMCEWTVCSKPSKPAPHTRASNSLRP
jgi:hypothetical protein